MNIGTPMGKDTLFKFLLVIVALFAMLTPLAAGTERDNASSSSYTFKSNDAQSYVIQPERNSEFNLSDSDLSEKPTTIGYNITILISVTASCIILALILVALSQYNERKAIESTAKAKATFFASVSHDIRTPLNAIIGFSEMLRDGVESKEVQKKYLDSILFSSNTLLQLINDVLDLSKLEAGKMVFANEPCDFRELSEKIVSAFRPQAMKNNVSLIMKIDKLPIIEIDQQRVRQILFNLIGNAVKFTAVGSITLSAYFETDSFNEGDLHFSVTDTGIGISEEDMRNLAQPFVQVRNTAGITQGTGLGLAICQQMLSKMNGKLSIKSTIGKGSTFSVVMRNVRYKWPTDEVNEQRTSHITSVNTETANLTLLIVDDTPLNLSVMTAMLKRIGLTKIITASNGKDALDKLAENPSVDIILTDMWMPFMGGADLVAAVRSNPKTANIIVYTVADVEAQKTYQDMGFNGILLKPLTIERFKELFENISKGDLSSNSK